MPRRDYTADCVVIASNLSHQWLGVFAKDFSCHLVPLSAITYTREWSLHPWDSSTIPHELLGSFNRIGILHKPILLAKEGGNFDILCGFKRLQFALTNAQEESIECLVLAKDTDLKIILDILLADQSLFHPLSLAEKATFVEICTHFLSQQDIVSVYLDALQLRKSISTITELKNILQQDQIIITEIHADRLQGKMVTEILRLSEDSDRIALVQLFRDLGMGNGKQKRFFTLIRDLAFRQNSTISAYLKTPAISEILEHPAMNVPQKIEHLNNYLQHQLYPMSLKAEEDFTRQVRELRLPSRCTISHSQAFENDGVTLSITFENFTDCAKIIPKLGTYF